MQQILESVMLICFGFSWPFTVIKNYKARSAKAMSLPFILLIDSGYVAGILAKIIGGQINYVLIIYFINLIVVSSNIVIYFRNRRIDRLSQAK